MTPDTVKHSKLTRQQFLCEYKNRIKIVDDEVFYCGYKGSPIYDASTATFLLETCLRGLECIMERRQGCITFDKTELLFNTQTMIRHKIWIRLNLSWGLYIKQSAIQRAERLKQKEELQKPRKKWHVQAHQQPAETKQPKAYRKTALQAKRAHIDPSKQPFHLHLTILDHFLWDS